MMIVLWTFLGVNGATCLTLTSVYRLTLLEGFTANGSLGYVYIVLYYEYTD